jgi:hypothetical protein
MEVVNHHRVGDSRLDPAAALDQLFARVVQQKVWDTTATERL